MKKTILSVSVALLLSSFGTSVMADDWEKELNEVSKDFSDVNIEISDISTLLQNNGLSEEEPEDISKKSAKESENKTLVKVDQKTDKEITNEKVKNDKSSVVATKNNDALKEAKPISKEINKEKVKTEDVRNVEVKKDEKNIKDISTQNVSIVKNEKTKVNVMTDQSDFVFLRNVPEGTRLTVMDSYTVLPKKKFIIFSEGERVLQSPQTQENPESKFCFIELVNSGKSRILKGNGETKLIITGNKTDVQEYDMQRSYGDYILRTYQTSFSVDNQNIKNITCYSAEIYQKDKDAVPKPLTLKDLRETTGSLFKIDFPAYEEI